MRNLEYTVTQGIVTGTLRTEAALKGICNTTVNRKYEHLYRGTDEEQIFFYQFAKENAAHINNSLTKVIALLLDDKDLISCLAE